MAFYLFVVFLKFTLHNSTVIYYKDVSALLVIFEMIVYSSLLRISNPRVSNFWRQISTISNFLFQNSSDFQKIYVISVAASQLNKGRYLHQFTFMAIRAPYRLQIFRVITCPDKQFITHWALITGSCAAQFVYKSWGETIFDGWSILSIPLKTSRLLDFKLSVFMILSIIDC
jgi:hypothetical protein